MLKTATRWCPGTDSTTCRTKETLDSPHQQRCPVCAEQQKQIDLARHHRERTHSFTSTAAQEDIAEARQVEASSNGMIGALKVFNAMMRVA